MDKRLAFEKTIKSLLPEWNEDPLPKINEFIAAKSLKAKSAMVLGQILPGVPGWKMSRMKKYL